MDTMEQQLFQEGEASEHLSRCQRHLCKVDSSFPEPLDLPHIPSTINASEYGAGGIISPNYSSWLAHMKSSSILSQR